MLTVQNGHKEACLPMGSYTEVIGRPSGLADAFWDCCRFNDASNSPRRLFCLFLWHEQSCSSWLL